MGYTEKNGKETDQRVSRKDNKGNKVNQMFITGEEERRFNIQRLVISWKFPVLEFLFSVYFLSKHV
jgi:hypothetical protein